MIGTAASERRRGARSLGEDSPEGGFIVVAVLWILGALATLATIYSLYTSSTALAARVNDDRLQSEALIFAALELTAYQVTPANAPNRPTHGSFSLHMGRADVQVGFAPEAGRIDLNEAAKEVLAGLFTALGSRKSDGDYYADRIIGWRTRNQEADQEEEASSYRVAGLGYKPRRAPFQSTAELWLVLGLPPTLVERMLPLVTVFSGRPDIDMAYAAPIAIAAQPGMTPDKLQGVLDGRAGVAGGSAAIRVPGAPAAGQGPAEAHKTIRVTALIRFANGRQVRAEVVILLLQDDEDPYHILSWHDDFDGPG